MPVNPHINVFRPYRDAGDGHEDQLTRAALIVMRLVPLAHDAFLRMAASTGLADVGPGVFDTQRRRLVEADSDAATDQEPIQRVVSVFLSPDESQPTPPSAGVTLADRGQRIDGLIRYDEKLVIAIESKLHAGASDWQARHLSPEGISAETVEPVRYVAWHELLERWLVLRDAGALAPAEESVVDDFFEMAEENFGWLLPFTTLARAGGNEERRLRRLRAILEAATGLTAANPRDPQVSLEAHVVSIQRARLEPHGDHLSLAVWPCELKPQALHVYATPERARALAALDGVDEFVVAANPHLAYRWAYPSQRLYMRWGRSPREYLDTWTSRDGLAHIRQYSAEEVRKELMPWLTAHGFLLTSDAADVESLLEAAGQRPIQLRPSVEVVRRWKYEDAVALDEAGELERQVREGLNRVLAALDEPLVPVEGG